MQTRDYFGWTVLSEDGRYVTAMDKNIDYTTESEQEIKEVLEHVDQRRCVLEAGVHYGFGTLLLSKIFNEVHTFDFNNDVHECFKMNMEKFGITNVVAHPYGLGSEDTEVHTNDRHPVKGRVPLANHVELADSQNGNKYRVMPLDHLHFDFVDLMCLDTEGYELFVLKGAQQTIRKHRPVLVIEFHKRNLSQKFFNVSPRSTEDYLDHLGYRYVKNLNKVDRLYVPK